MFPTISINELYNQGNIRINRQEVCGPAAEHVPKLAACGRQAPWLHPNKQGGYRVEGERGSSLPLWHSQEGAPTRRERVETSGVRAGVVTWMNVSQRGMGVRPLDAP